MKITCAKLAGGPRGPKPGHTFDFLGAETATRLQALRHNYQASLHLAIALPQTVRLFYVSLRCLEQVSVHRHYDIGISSFPGAGDVWFSLGNVTYQNKSNVILENIGEGDDALLCKTNRTACCHHHIVGMRHSMGNWFFPNGTKVPRVNTTSGEMRDFYRDRGQMVVRMHRRGGGVEGIYRCEIPDTFGFIQTLYIGVYSLSTGEWYMYTPVQLWSYCSTVDNMVNLRSL